MSRKSTTLATSALLACGVLSGAVLWSAGPLAQPAAAAAGDPGRPFHATPRFARSVSGTWLEHFGSGQTLVNINADGTLTWFGTWFFGNGFGQSIDGPVYGSWRQTGPLELTTIELGFLFDGDGVFWATGRVKEIYTFSPDFQSFTYHGTEDLFFPHQNPTDPNEEPFLSFNFGPGHVQRMNFQ